MKEIWKDIKNYEGLYQVSNLGRVRSLDFQCWNGVAFWLKKGGVLVPRLTKSGYCRVQLKGKDFYIHRLVAEHFLSNPNNFNQVNHKDEDKNNNSVTNLEWCSQKYNNCYGTRLERIASKHRGRMINNKEIYQLSLDGEILQEYPSAMIAASVVNVDNSSICKVANGRLKTAGGFKWRWKRGDE